MKKHLILLVICTLGFYASAQDSTDCILSANFTYSIEGDEISFTNTSTGTTPSTEYEWIIDDVTYLEENPTVSTDGFEDEETVCLYIYDFDLPECIDTLCTLIIFEEDTTFDDSTDCMLSANFTYSIDGDEISFTNTSTGTTPSTEYEWIIDDVTYLEENPTVSTDGFEDEETVCLYIYDFDLPECIDTLCMLIIFEDDTTFDDSTDCMIMASFTYSIDGDEISFTNTSTGTTPSTAYEWIIDGTSYLEENPTVSTDGMDDSEIVCFYVYDSEMPTCIDTLCMTINLSEEDSTLSVPTLESLEFITFPNPTTGLVTVTSSQSINGVIQVTSLLGKVVIQEQVSAASNDIDLSYLPQGLYFLEVRDERGENVIYRQKVLKE